MELRGVARGSAGRASVSGKRPWSRAKRWARVSTRADVVAPSVARARRPAPRHCGRRDGLVR
jgi:hypothetical protein